MSKKDQAEHLFAQLQRQYPRWPSTFSECGCGRGSARGGGQCSECIVDELSELVPRYTAEVAMDAIAEVHHAWVAIADHLDTERNKELGRSGDGGTG